MTTSSACRDASIPIPPIQDHLIMINASNLMNENMMEDHLKVKYNHHEFLIQVYLKEKNKLNEENEIC